METQLKVIKNLQLRKNREMYLVIRKIGFKINISFYMLFCYFTLSILNYG